MKQNKGGPLDKTPTSDECDRMLVGVLSKGTPLFCFIAEVVEASNIFASFVIIEDKFLAEDGLEVLGTLPGGRCTLLVFVKLQSSDKFESMEEPDLEF
jgi:hypothetical protein